MNLLLIVLAIIMIWRMIEGYRVGMVKEIISFVSLAVMSVAVVLIGIGLNSYMEKDTIKTIVVVILFLILCIVHRIISLIFFSAKLISKLPVVSTANRLLGAVMGVLETVLIVWVIFALIMNFGLGVIGQQILLYVQDSPILTFLYEHNYLAYWVGILSEKAAFLPLELQDVTDAAENVKDIITNENILSDYIN